MLSAIKTYSSEVIDQGRRLVKFLRFGKSDVQTALQVAPYGIDSNPVKDMVAIYAPTQQKGETVVIGYINKNQLANVGEFRMFSTDENGTLKFAIYLKNDGTVEIGGNTKNMTRFQELESGFNELRSDFNAHVQKFNAHTHPGVQSGGAVTGATTTPSDPSAASIAGAKIDQIKTL